MKLNVTIPIEQSNQLKDQSEMLREAATYEHAGCTASAMGWAIKYANIHERMEAAATEIERLREALREIRFIAVDADIKQLASEAIDKSHDPTKQ
jgi:hypothetical protein